MDPRPNYPKTVEIDVQEEIYGISNMVDWYVKPLGILLVEPPEEGQNFNFTVELNSPNIIDDNPVEPCRMPLSFIKFKEGEFYYICGETSSAQSDLMSFKQKVKIKSNILKFELTQIDVGEARIIPPWRLTLDLQIPK